MATLFTWATKAAWGAVQAADSSRVSDVTSPAPPPGTGFSTSMAFDMRDGEKWITSSGPEAGSGERCEVANSATGRRYEQDKVYWIRFWARVPSTWPTSASDWNYFFQVHLAAGGTQPVLMVGTSTTGNLQIKTSQGGGHTLRWDEPLVKDVWHKFVMRVVFSKTTTLGSLDVWKDDVHVIDSLAVAMIPATDDGTPYQKCGVYRSSSYTTNTFSYIHGFEVFDSDPDGGGGGGTTAPTPTAPAASKWFGNATGTLWNDSTPDSIRGSEFELTERGTVTAINLWLDGYGSAGSGSQKAKATIHRVSDEAKVVESAEVTVTYGTAEGYVGFTVSPAVELGPGTYRVGLHTAANRVIRWAYGAVTDALQWGPATYASGVPNPWTQTGVDAKRLVAHAVYTAVAPGTIQTGAAFVDADALLVTSTTIDGSGNPAIIPANLVCRVSTIEVIFRPVYEPRLIGADGNPTTTRVYAWSDGTWRDNPQT